MNGKKKVRNTNPKTKDRHPEVSVSTLLRTDKSLQSKLRKEFTKWNSHDDEHVLKGLQKANEGSKKDLDKSDKKTQDLIDKAVGKLKTLKGPAKKEMADAMLGKKTKENEKVDSLIDDFMARMKKVSPEQRKQMMNKLYDKAASGHLPSKTTAILARRAASALIHLAHKDPSHRKDVLPVVMAAYSTEIFTPRDFDDDDFPEEDRDEFEDSLNEAESCAEERNGRAMRSYLEHARGLAKSPVQKAALAKSEARCARLMRYHSGR